MRWPLTDALDFDRVYLNGRKRTALGVHRLFGDSVHHRAPFHHRAKDAVAVVPIGRGGPVHDQTLAVCVRRGGGKGHRVGLMPEGAAEFVPQREAGGLFAETFVRCDRHPFKPRLGHNAVNLCLIVKRAPHRVSRSGVDESPLALRQSDKVAGGARRFLKMDADPEIAFGALNKCENPVCRTGLKETGYQAKKEGWKKPVSHGKTMVGGDQ